MKEKLELVNKAIDIELREDIRSEAKEMVALAPEIMLNELLQYFIEGEDNLFCMCLDVIKRDLIAEGIIKDSDFPSFGHPFDLI